MKKRIAAVFLAALLVLAGGCGVPGTASSPTVAVNTPPAASEAASADSAISKAHPAGSVSSAAPAAAASPSEAQETADPPAEKPAASIPAGVPQPTEGVTLTCTLCIRCDTILDNMDKLAEEKAELVPEDGILLREEKVAFQEDESVFDLLLRVTREKKMHLEFVDTPLYHSAYIEGIGNIYEFDCGELSGWSYKVNGEFPSYGCSLYKLKDGDAVEWVYTCDLGKDVGGGNGLGGGT